jgi:L-threonylcarbamoyladenylate synthase
MPTVPATDFAVRRAADILRRGGLVAFPTETVYGLGADALSGDACARIFAVKRRPRFDPLIVHVLGVEALEPLCSGIDDRVRRLVDAFWPGPLTLVLPKTLRVPDIVTAGLPTVAVRAPSHPVARALLAAVDRPIAAPSANPFGYVSPTSAEHVEAQLGGEVDLILDGGPCEIGIESTIVDLSGERPILVRAGGVEVERLESIIGPLAGPRPGDSGRAPGQFASHYAPRVPLTLLEGRAGNAEPGARVGLLAFGRPDPAAAATYAVVELLSPSESVREAAANLFACLRRLDQSGLDAIVAERVPAVGLGVAILDRLTRASVRGRREGQQRRPWS